MKDVYVDLSQGMRCTQTCATTQSEQTLMVPIKAPPVRRLRVNYNIFKGPDDEDKDMKKHYCSLSHGLSLFF